MINSKIVIASALVTLSSCSQFTTSDEEKAALQASIDAGKAAYIECMDSYATRNSAMDEPATIIIAGANLECKSLLEDYGSAEAELAKMQYMSGSYREELVKERVESLQKEAEETLIQVLLKARGAT